MKRTIPSALALSFLACLVAGGCAEPKVLVVNQRDSDELEAVSVFASARENYHYRLAVLQAYYDRFGNHDKLEWATKELTNLERSQQAVQWQNLPEVLPPKGEPVREGSERLLVEFAVSARKEYLGSAKGLAELYEQKGQTRKAMLARALVQALNPVQTYMYFLDAEIPGPDLRPMAVIPEAERLFERAYALYIEGKGILHTFITTDRDKERQALELLLELVRTYPRSTKIALAAYFIGDIYKEYFDENVRAVHWYERAWQWDPNVSQPARFQAAVVYDLRLKDPDKAVELYQASIRHDPFRLRNADFARSRIEELTGASP
jgi:tetratricopeptide (TPR) repeat protein